MRKVRISVSDKSGEFVIMTSNLDNELMKKHLGNEILYFNEVWEYVGKKNYVIGRSIGD